MANRHAKRVVALFSACDETVAFLRWMRGISDVHEFIWCRFADLTTGRIDVAAYLAESDPQVVIVDIGPPYLENWRFFQALRAAPAMIGRSQVLITTNRAQLDAVLGENSQAIDIVGSPDVLHQVVTAIEDASASLTPKSGRGLHSTEMDRSW